MIKGKFLAHDDFDLAGHRLLNWIWLKDLPTQDATDGQVIAYIDGCPTWSTMTSSGIVSVAWDDITGKPASYPPSSHTHPWDQVTGKPTFVNSITAGIGIDISSTTGNVLISDQYAPDTDKPTGFVNTTDSTRSHTNNRTYTIEPVGSSFRYYVDGVQFNVATTENVTWPDTDGLYWFFFNENGTLTRSTTGLSDEDLIMHNALVGNVYWDATNNTVIGHSEERHGINMSPSTHHYLHETEGARFHYGHALGDIDSSGNGNLNSHATMSVAAGEIADEDLFLPFIGTVGATQIFNVYFKEGAGLWRRANPAVGAPVINNTTWSRLAYNHYNTTLTSWTQADPGQGKYVLAHVFRTNSLTNGYIGIQGENVYSTEGAARSGANVEIADLVVAGLPTKEFIPLGSIIYQTRDSYANDFNARIRPTDTGQDYVDWRTEELTPGSGPTNHSNLSGLSNPDHPLTALQQSSATTNQAAVWSGATWTAQPVVNDVTAGTNITVSATNGTALSIASVTNPDFTNITVAGSLAHTGDPGTSIVFGTDTLDLKVASTELLQITASTVQSNAPLKQYGNAWFSSTITAVGVVDAVGLSISGTALRPEHLDGTGYSSGNVPTWNGTTSEFAPATPSGGGTATTTFANIYIGTAVIHDGDTDTRMEFDTNKIDFYCGNDRLGGFDSDSATYLFDAGPTQEFYITAAGQVDISGDLYLGDTIYAGNKIIHRGDTDTFMEFTANSITFSAGGEDLLFLNNGSATAHFAAGPGKQLKINGAGQLDVSGDMYISSRIYSASGITHRGNTDNRIKFGTDVQAFEVGGVTVLEIQETTITAAATIVADEIGFESNKIGMIFRHGTADRFRMYGGSGNLLRIVSITAGGSDFNHTVWNDSGQVGIQTATPTADLDVNGTINANTFTVGGAALAQPLTAGKAADTDRNSTATFADDPDLTVAVESGGVYHVDMLLVYSANTTPDLKYQFVTTTGNGTLLVDDTFVYNMNFFGLATAQSVPCSGWGSHIGAAIHGVLYVAGAADTFKVQWAQNSSNAGTSTMHKGSMIRLTKLN